MLEKAAFELNCYLAKIRLGIFHLPAYFISFYVSVLPVHIFFSALLIHLGTYVLSGVDGFPKDPEYGFKIFEDLAESGDTHALFKIGKKIL